MNQKRIWDLWRAAPNGHSTIEIAQRVGLPECEVDKTISRCLDAVYCNLPMPWTQRAKMVQRNREIVTLRRQSQTLQQIGDRFGISRERVRQILSNPTLKRPPLNLPVLDVRAPRAGAFSGGEG